MATEEALSSRTYPANADLSAKQFYFVTLNSSGNVALAAAGHATGVLQNKPAAAGRAASVAVSGRTKVVGGGTVNPGDAVTSDANGKCVATTSGASTLGVCVEGMTSTTIGSIELAPLGAPTL